MTPATSDSAVALPAPRTRRLRLPLPRARRGWLLLAAAAALAGVVAGAGYQGWHNRGTAVTIRFQDAHGLRVGADVRYRGVSVGRVTDVRLQPVEGGAEVRVTLNPDGEGLARAGSHFWIVRPAVSLTAGVSGLDTVAGDNYLAVRPAPGGEPATAFVGAEAAPLPDVSPGSLSVLLNAKRKSFGLRPGAAVTCCGMPVGLVRSVALARDGKGVQAVVCIERQYAGLVYKNTRFYEPEVVQFNGGFSGFKGHVDLQALGGGIALKVPARPELCPADWQPRFNLADTP